MPLEKIKISEIKNKKLNILGKKVPVRVKKIDECGYYSPETGEIVLSRDYCDMETLVHEMTHAYFEISGMRQDISGAFEHMIIRLIERMIFDNFDIKLKK